MAFKDIDKRRFSYLLQFGTADDELRLFFSSSRVMLIQKGGRVQNLPHGKENRIRMLTQGLPKSTDAIVQKWFSANLTMTDPVPAIEIINAFKMHEEGDILCSEDDARKLSRSCLVDIFSISPNLELLTFLRTPIKNSGATYSAVIDDKTTYAQEDVGIDFASALLSVVENKDPDPFLSGLKPSLAGFVAGLYAATNDETDELDSALDCLTEQPDVRQLLAEFGKRKSIERTNAAAITQGLIVSRLAEPDESFAFDEESDEIIGQCTKDYPENAVFVHPFAVRTSTGELINLSPDLGKTIFYQSGDVIAFHGRNFPRQPKRGEIGIWKVAKIENHNPSHRTSFQLCTERISVYEVRAVPFGSREHDAVREYIKDQIETCTDQNQSKKLLFILRDHLIVGSPPGKDLSKDDGFEGGIPCWRSLNAFRYEGRTYVADPLPGHEKYECEPLSSSLRKLIHCMDAGPEKPTRAQARRLQEIITSGEVQLNIERANRIRAELDLLGQQDELVGLLLESAMQQPEVTNRINVLVEKEVSSQLTKKAHLRAEIEKLEKHLADLLERKLLEEKKQKSLAPAVSKAIRQSFEKAKNHGIEALGESVVFQALMETVSHTEASASVAPQALAAKSQMDVRNPTTSFAIDTRLRSFNIAGKHSSALQIAGKVITDAGLILIVEGMGARLAVESWCYSFGVKKCVVLECAFGITEDQQLKALMQEGPELIAILDANLSPIDVYARPVLDSITDFLSGPLENRELLRVILSTIDSLASLPIPKELERISVRISLDTPPQFISDAEAKMVAELDLDEDEPPAWLTRLWGPAAKRLHKLISELDIENAALAISAIQQLNQRP
jgi:hypothetical protein